MSYIDPIRRAAEITVMKQVVLDGYNPLACYDDFIQWDITGEVNRTFMLIPPLKHLDGEELVNHINQQSEVVYASYLDVLEIIKIGLHETVKREGANVKVSSFDMQKVFQAGITAQTYEQS